MTDYYKHEFLEKSKKQKNTVLTVYLIILGLYLILCTGLFLWYRTLTYKSPTISKVKFYLYLATIIIVIFSFIYLGIIFKRVNKFYKFCSRIEVGIKETTVATFVKVNETIQDKEGVDFKSLIFSEWNKYKKDYFERKVLVFNELPFPEFNEGDTVKFITQGNVLVSYEII